MLGDVAEENVMDYVLDDGVRANETFDFLPNENVNKVSIEIQR